MQTERTKRLRKNRRWFNSEKSCLGETSLGNSDRARDDGGNIRAHGTIRVSGLGRRRFGCRESAPASAGRGGAQGILDPAANWALHADGVFALVGHRQVWA